MPRRTRKNVKTGSSKVTPKAKTIRKKKSKIFPDAYCRRYPDRPVLLDEILKRNGKNDSVAKKGPPEKKKRCTQDKRQDQPLLGPRKTRSNKAPDLVENNRTGEKNSPSYGYFYFNKKCFGNSGSNQTLPGTKALSKRSHRESENRVRKKITESGG